MPRKRKQSENELKLMDDPDFNELLDRRLHNSYMIKSHQAVLKDYEKWQCEMDAEIAEVMGGCGVEKMATADATVSIAYGFSVEVRDKQKVPDRYKVRKLSEEISNKKILEDFEDGYDLGESIQIVERTSVRCQRRKGKQRLRDIEEQKERLEGRYEEDEEHEED